MLKPCGTGDTRYAPPSPQLSSRIPYSGLACALFALLACACGGGIDLEDFTVQPPLELTLWAREPDLVNPTNMAIDERGRVWVIESPNYRRLLKGEEESDPAGDRITILEDTDGDGRADRRKVFDQSPELRAPLGIAVLGDKVYVSRSPDLIVYTKDADDNIVNREVLLTGWGGVDHDHGLHAIVFGPDGRLYFNHGNLGFDVVDKSGKRVVSSPEGPYYAGAVLRMNPDGTDLTVLAHNFRNPYEMAIDSFGTIFQTDNDDDGNRWTRLNYVMEGGDYGYWGPGALTWREDRGTHFHHELPGVVPDIARTGPGSPTGLLVYEGSLLPRRYHGALIHAEAGKRRVFAFLLRSSGAGFSMDAEELIASEDPNFRPSDVAVAPDGSLFITDWYDPVVGGHAMKDHEKGRIYRLAPKGHKPVRRRVDLATDEGLAAALGSPNQAVRYLGYHGIQEQEIRVVRRLKEIWYSSDPAVRARALWLLLRHEDARPRLLREALGHGDERIRILGLRAGLAAGLDPLELIHPLLEDPKPRVRREAALALQHVEGEAAVEPLIELAKQYDGFDRWYLEAWAIGARGKQELLYEPLLEAFPGEWDPRLAQFFWELKPARALPYLTRALRDDDLSVEDRLEALRAIGDRADAASARVVAAIVREPGFDAALREKAFEKLSRQLFSQWKPLRADPALRTAVQAALGDRQLQETALTLVRDLGDRFYADQTLALAESAAAPEPVRALALEALGEFRDPRFADTLQRFAESGPTTLSVAAVRGLAAAKPEDLNVRLRALILSEAPNEVRSQALRSLARGEHGLETILDLEEAQGLPAELVTLAGNLARRGKDKEIRERAERLFPAPADKRNQALPYNPRAISNRIGDAAKGRTVFEAKDGPKCVNCHSLEDGKELAGPNLSAIGSKSDKEALLDSILNPSAGIAPEYAVWIFETTSAGLVTGVVAENTPERVVVRDEFGDEIRLRPAEITSRRKSNLSMMPEDLVTTMAEQELIDLLEFLSTLTGAGE